MRAEQGSILTVDVGGTTIDSAVITSDLVLVGSVHTIASDSGASKDDILRCFDEAISMAVAESRASNLVVRACSMAVPNPFDYESGVSNMEHKFQAIQGVNLREQFAKQYDFPFFFLNDADAFGYGVLGRNYTVTPERLVTVTLGTGIGSAYFVNGQPHELEIWNAPYAAGILEDAISAKAVAQSYEALAQHERSVKDIAELARAGDRLAQDVFQGFGEQLGAGLASVVGSLAPTVIALGGAISRSAVLFRTAAELAYREQTGQTVVFDWKQDANLALYGAALYAEGKS